MSDFVAATTHQIKWEVGENRFDKDGKNPKKMSLFISKDSILEFAAYLQRLAGETDRIKTGKVWDFVNREEIEVEGFYLNGKGKSSKYGDFGAINLQQIPGSDRNAPTQASPRWDHEPLVPDTADIPF